MLEVKIFTLYPDLFPGPLDIGIVSKINKLLKQFKMMSDMMKKMSQGKKIPSGMIPDEMLKQLK